MNKFKLLAILLCSVAMTACVVDEGPEDVIDDPDIEAAVPPGKTPGTTLMSICDTPSYWSACKDDDDCETCCAARAYACFDVNDKQARTLHTEACRTQYCVDPEDYQLPK